MRDRFVENVVIKRMEQLFAICPTVKEGGDMRTYRACRQVRISTAASDVGCHRERISYVSHTPAPHHLLREKVVFVKLVTRF
jgi:hypothetical protein